MTPIGRIVSVAALLGLITAICLAGALPIIGFFAWPAVILGLLLLLPIVFVVLRPRSK